MSTLTSDSTTKSSCTSLQLIIAALPLLLPTFITLVIVRLSLDARKSRSRIRLLESHESYRDRLAHAVAQMEKQVEDAVVDYMDDPGALAALASDPGTGSPSTATLIEPQTIVETKVDAGPSTVPVSGPSVTELQRRIVKSLNTLPRMKKELVYVHPVLNSHAVIIARDVKRFEHHKQGHGVLRHLADNFVM